MRAAIVLAALLFAVPALGSEPITPADATPEPGLSCDCQDYQQWHHNVIRSRDVWPMWQGDSTFKIAIIGSGLDPDAFEFVDNYGSNLWKNAAEVNGVPGIDDDGNGKVDDKWGWDFEAGEIFGPEEGNWPEEGNHTGSTFWATFIAGRGPERAYRGIGVCPKAKAMAIKYLMAGLVGGDTNEQIRALQYARQNGAKVAFVTGQHTFYQPFQDELALWDSYGGIVVCQSGTSALNLDQPVPPGWLAYPAAYSNPSLLVALPIQRTSGGSDVFVSGFSYGANSVDLAAPYFYGSFGGPGTLYAFSTSINELWAFWSNSDMAAAEVAGAVALLWSKFPSATRDQIKSALMNNGDLLSVANGRSRCNGGSCRRLNILNAYMALSGGLGETESATPGPVAESGKAPVPDDGKRYDVQGRRMDPGAPGVVFGGNRKRVVVKP